MIRKIFSILLVFLIPMVSLFANGQQESEYPTRPITIICPWSAGGGTDAVARIIAAELQEDLGQPVNVVNKTGGGGVVGHTAIAEAKNDGYTIGLATTELAMMHWMGLTEISVEQFVPIALANTDPAAIFVSSDSEWSDMDVLFKYIEDNPDSLQASGASVGGTYHLSFVGALQTAHLSTSSVKWIPSKGAAPALQDLVAGGIDVVCASLPEAGALIEAGKIKPLAILNTERDPIFSNIPTLIELGYNWTGMAWRGVVAPLGTSEDIVSILSKSIEDIVNGPVYEEFMNGRGYGISFKNAEEFMDFMKQKDKENGLMLKAAGIIK